jgi:Ulp1 family protease
MNDKTWQLQTNQYDCGLWVLGTIAATLQGYHLPDLIEDDMVQVRKFLGDIVLSLPCTH